MTKMVKITYLNNDVAMHVTVPEYKVPRYINSINRYILDPDIEEAIRKYSKGIGRIIAAIKKFLE